MRLSFGKVDFFRFFTAILFVLTLGIGLSAALPWQSKDIGDPPPSLPGTDAISGASITMEGGGADIWSWKDQFYYVYLPLDGDGEIVAKLNGIENTHAWAKAGVMIREKLSSKAKNVLLAVTPTKGVRFQKRISNAGPTSASGFAGSAPRWLKLTRIGDVFFASRSIDGVVWKPSGSAIVPMKADVLIGLAVTAHDDTKLCTAEFSDISVKSRQNRKLAISGELYDNAGDPLGSPTPVDVDAAVKLYTAKNGGSVKYAETFLAANSQAITVEDGLFVARLGEGTTSNDLQDLLSNHGSLWVEITVDAGSGPEVLSPRTPLTAAAYSLGGVPTFQAGSQTIREAGDPGSSISAIIGTYYVNTDTKSTWIKVESGWKLID